MHKKQDIGVIILTHNEELHIERCITSLLNITSNIFIVDSFSTDKTVEIAESLGAVVVQRKWKNYADQFQWGIENCNFGTNWLMRMDADEYLEAGLIDEINNNIDNLKDNVAGIYLKRKVIFKGQWIKRGGFYPHILLRLWRNGVGRIEQRWMDEHIVLSQGETVTFNHDIVDENLNDITWWINKHNAYATREMIDLMNIKYNFMQEDRSLLNTNDPQARKKRFLKNNIYSKLPIGLRSILYFIYRYIFKLGFLDGRQGFVFHFMQGFWYRFLVDVKVEEFEEGYLSQDQNVSTYIKKVYNIDVS